VKIVSATAVNVAASRPPLADDLSALLARHVHEQPERIAVGTSDLRTAISYRQLDTLVRSAAEQLSRLGLSRGDTIAFVSDNSVELAVGLLAIVSSGARVAPLNPALTPPELSTRLSALSARALLVPKLHAEQLELWQLIAGSAARWIMSIEGSGSAPEVRVANAKQIAGSDIPGTTEAT
jgi:acyl-CoA synthetase (AMP-forming)/AMP-acid ligase II